MQRGSLLECIANSEWTSTINNQVYPGPKRKEIVTHDGGDAAHPGWIKLLEYDDVTDLGRLYYPEIFFREILPPMDLNIENIISESIKL